MLRNYLKIARRNLLKNKSHSAINIMGLAVGMASFLLILFYVQDESSFDKFHNDYESIYRVTEVNYTESGETKLANTYSGIGPALHNDFPEVETFVRLYVAELSVSDGATKKFMESRFTYADSTFWEIFDFELLQGDPKTALSSPFSVVLTESTATKYFGTENAIGKVLKVDEKFSYQVTGIVEDTPDNSHLQFDLLASFTSLQQLIGGYMYNNWHYPPMYTYARIPSVGSISAVEGKFPGMVEKYLGKLVAEQRGFALQPLEDIHTSTNYTNEIGKSTNVTYLYVLTTTAFLILAIACVNFMNLSLARSMSRSGEVGVRKVFGAVRKQIMFQYLSETVIITTISSVLGFGLFVLAIPAFNDLSEKALSLQLADIPLIVGGLLMVAVLVGLLSGIYPALFLSGLSPASILKGKLAKQGKFTSLFKKGLITFQFVISAALIIATFIIYFQLEYVRNKALGFDKEQMVVVQIRNMTEKSRIKTLKDRLNQLPQVIGTAVSSRVPGYKNFYDYNVLADGEVVENNQVFMRLEMDLDFAKLYGFEISKGRLHDEQLSTDSLKYLLNETAAAKLGWSEDPLNKKLNIGSLKSDGTFNTMYQGNIIGVVKDFNFASLHNQVDPVVLSIIPPREPFLQSLLSIRLQSGNLVESMKVIESEWRGFAPSVDFEYFFLDDAVDRLYQSEKQLGKVFITFSFVSIILACLGLFAMTTLLASQLRKEIGIRKVLGASISNIVLLMSKGYMQLIGLSFLIACSITYFMMQRWLENFAYQIRMEIWYFLMAGILLAFIAFMTMSFKSFKAARGNPVDALRYE
ncbi:MAG: FtsX-like permease family protein [Roseivirga sp.]|nr:FtsX-like permease family protein [Roseivirga sp.]